MEHKSKKGESKPKRKLTVGVLLGIFLGLCVFSYAVERIIGTVSFPTQPLTLPPPAPSISEVMDAIPSMTKVQREDYLSNMRGKTASYWSGKVTEVEEYGDDYRVSLIGLNGEESADIFLYGLTKAEVIYIEKNSILKFSGIIERVEYHTGLFSSGLVFSIRNVDFRTPTLPPSRTMSPTATPRPTRTKGPTITPGPTRTSGPSKTPRPTKTITRDTTLISSPEYYPLLMHIYRDVKVYFGDDQVKTFAFTIIGADDDCGITPSGKGVLVKYPDGTKEWKDRVYLLSVGYVRSDDPFINLPRMDYYECP